MLRDPREARPGEAVRSAALAVLERTAEANAKRLDVQVDLAEINCTLGEIEAADGQPERARGYFEQALAIRKRRVETDPSDEPSIAFVADSFRRIGTALQASGRPADAVAHYRRSIAILEGLKRPRALDLYDAACCRCLISAAAAEPGSA